MNGELSYEERESVGKLMSGLFMVIMLNIVVSIFIALGEGAYEEKDGILFVAGIVSFLFLTVYGVLLIAIDKWCSGYNTAGILCIAYAIVNLITSLMEKTNIIITIIIMIMIILKDYKEIDAHTYLMKKIQNRDVEWSKLSDMLGAYISVYVISLVLAALIPPVGAIGALVAAIIYLVFSIKKWIYLNKTAKILKEEME